MGWSQIPAEIFDIILEDLDLNDIKNLRLVDKSAARKCLGPRILSHASTAETHLTGRSLWDLMARSSHPAFGPAVRQLSILAVCYNQSTRRIKLDFLERGNHRPHIPIVWYNIDWVREQQRIRDSRSDRFIIDILVSALDSFTGLQCIVLHPWVINSPSQKWWPFGSFASGMSPWISHVCYLVLAAASQSRTTARHLNLYSKRDTISLFNSKTRSPSKDVYGVLCEDLASHLVSIRQSHGDIQFPFETLHISLCTEVRTASWPEYSWSRALSSRRVSASSNPDGENQKDSSGLMQLLKSTPNLQRLHLYFNYGDPVIPTEYFDIFNGVAELSFPRLAMLSLEDLPATSTAILQFLRAHRNIWHLTLNGVSIPVDEDWDPIFRLISEEMMDLLVLVVSDCCQGKNPIPLDCDPFFEKYFSSRRFVPIDLANDSGPDIYMFFPPETFE